MGGGTLASVLHGLYFLFINQAHLVPFFQFAPNDPSESLSRYGRGFVPV